MSKYNIFVSAVQKELKEERRAIKDFVLNNVLLKEYFNVFLFEDLPAKNKPAQKIYLDEVDKCDIFIGILGNTYGSTGKDKISATEKEFREAQKTEKHILIFIKGNNSMRDKKVAELIREMQDAERGYCTKNFNVLTELQNSIHECLIEFLRNQGIVGKSAFDNTICKNAIFNDIDETKIKWFLQRAKSRRNFPLGIDTPVKEVLTHVDLLSNGSLKNAALLLFGKNPHKQHLQAEIKCVQFSGIEVEKPFPSYQTYSSNLFEQIDKAVAFILGAIKLTVIQQAGTAAASRPFEIPEFVIQEAITNAVAHRDYNNNAGVQVMVFIDRVEVWNPGRLPSQMTIADLKRPHTSHPNNPLLAEILFLSDYIQKVGSGTLEMIKQCRDRGLPEPEFVQLPHEFRVIIGRDIFTENVLVRLGLNDRQMKAVKYVKKRLEITNKVYQQLCKTSERTATRDLADLVSRIVFEQVGVTGKGTKYILKTPQRRQRRHEDATKTPKGQESDER